MMHQWHDTIGQNIHAVLLDNIMHHNPDVHLAQANHAINGMTKTVAVIRTSISDVIEGEIETLAFRRSLGDDSIGIEFLAGMLAALELVRDGKHLKGE
jgi:hypothetical protein